MKRIILLFIISFPCIFVNSCSSNFVKISQEYSNQNIKDKTLAIIFIPEDPYISNWKDVKHGIGPGDEEEVYKKYFFQVASERIKKITTFKDIVFSKKIDRVKEVRYAIDSTNPLEILLPIRSNFVLDYKDVDFALIIQELEVYTKLERIVMPPIGPNSNMPYTRIYTTTRPKLVHKAKFVIVDNHENKLVQYGEIALFEAFSFRVKEFNWHNIISEFIDNIFSEGPFTKENE